MHRPVAVLLTTLTVIVLGLLAAARLPISLLPEVGIPRVSVQVSYPNAAARTVEDAVVAPLRNTLLQVNGLTDIQSRARDEAAILYLDFPFGTNPDLAFIEVNEKIDLAMNQLPREVERPRVLATDVSDIPVVQLSVTLRARDAVAGALPAAAVQREAAEMLELSELARNVLRRRLEQLPEVAFADLSGQRNPRIVIRPNQPALRAVGLTENDLGGLLRSANVELGGLLLRDGYYEYAVRFTGGLRTTEDLRALYLNLGGDRTVALGDLAEVSYEASPARGTYLYDGQPGVVFTVRKRADASLFDLRENLGLLLDDLRAQYPELHFALNNDQTSVLRASMDNLTGGLLYGAGFAILILFAFFREWRRPLLIGLAVPVALLIAVLGFYLVGLSINVISLAGLILGVGLMIDNSIIVLDNIRQYQGRGGTEVDERARVATATNEVIRPLLSSALTTVAVFFPLVLLSGIAGALFRDQAISVTLALVASLAVAYFLLPMLTTLLGRGRVEAASVAASEKIISEEGPSLWVRLGQGLLLLLWFGLGLVLVRALPSQGFPALSRTDYQLRIEWNEALPLDVHRTRVRALNDDWRARFGGQTAAFLGENQFLLAEENQAMNAAELQYFLAAPPAAEDFAAAWLAEVRAQYPRAGISFRPLANLFDRIFLNDAPYLELRLRATGERGTPPPEAVDELVAGLAAAGFAPELPGRAEALALRIDYPQLAISRVDAEVLRGRLLTLFSENEATRLRVNDRALPVLLASADSLSAQRLLAATVTNRDGNEIPLAYLLERERRSDYRVLTADRAGEYLALPFAGAPGAEAVELISSVAARYPALNSQLAGRYLEDQTRLGELAGILLVSLLLLYLILAAQFEGLRLPLVVLLIVPVSLVGALLALWLTGGSLNLLSLIGMVVSGGIVVNDAIIKVDMIERSRREGLPLNAALRRANQRRLRAIVMTSLTTILALAPVLFTSGLGAELQQPLAITVIGGLTVGTLASLYVVPFLYRVLGGPGRQRFLNR
ncbi:efflux RND transporter permease subunit [Neolewinella lacunae]|nr:efflux RND transporter permease subunit [Neolewinella lacunae]MDN3633384.1 efflux RND transporter permease subunit [Neolewinella lacunae]